MIGNVYDFIVLTVKNSSRTNIVPVLNGVSSMAKWNDYSSIKAIFALISCSNVIWSSFHRAQYSPTLPSKVMDIKFALFNGPFLVLYIK